MVSFVTSARVRWMEARPWHVVFATMDSLGTCPKPCRLSSWQSWQFAGAGTIWPGCRQKLYKAQNSFRGIKESQNILRVWIS